MTTRPSHPYTPPGTRGVSLRGRPTVSVVIASQGSPETLAACLASLADQARRHEAEIVVVRGLGDETTLQQAHPTVRFITAEPGTERPLLRELGLAAAVGDIVAIADDDCLAAGEWLDRLVMSGTAEGARPAPRPGSTGTGEWAAYLTARGFSDPNLEVVHADEPATAGYAHTMLDYVAALAAAGKWDGLMHPDRAHDDAEAAVSPRPPVDTRSSFRTICRDRFIHGCAHARRRLAAPGRAPRVAALAGALALPFRRAWPAAAAVRPRRHGSRLRALPLTFALVTAWSLGEAWGYVSGIRGRRAGLPPEEE